MTVPIGTQTNDVFLAPVNLGELVAFDQTGRFPTTSFNGSKYIMVLYSYDANGILAHSLKNRSENELVKTVIALHKRIDNTGIPITLHFGQRMSNKT